ncbi:MAG: hypothetical protein Q7U85_07260, partial [Rhodocyclaceae bacterium]|nr:hypothetical protein [Rhodocyclaceae bacterium]
MNAHLPAGLLQDADFPRLTLVELHRLQPAFDRLPLAEAQARRCALFRDDKRLVGVLGDPLAADLQRWVEARAGDCVDWYLAAAEDLGDWLARQAQPVSALAG